MTSTPRWRTVRTCFAAAALLFAVAAPAAAAPAAEGGTSLISEVFAWLTGLGEPLDLDHTTATGTSAPNMDPTGAASDGETSPNMDPDGNYATSGGDDGETSPNMDPNG